MEFHGFYGKEAGNLNTDGNSGGPGARCKAQDITPHHSSKAQ